jgi:predicted nuclease of predicted toxin-antitoxin system
LRTKGHDVVTAFDAGNAGRAVSDEEVLTYATNDGRVVLTLDRRDFIRLHREKPAHAGIVVCTQDPDPEAQADRIHAAINGASVVAGQLLRVARPPR